MKVSRTLFFLLVITINLSYGQTPIKIPISVLKESKAIDALLDTILDSRTKPNNIDSANALQSGVIILHFFKVNNNLGLSIHSETRKTINAMFNYPQQGKITFGYFKYKGNDVFVADFDSFSEFFSKALSFKTLKFIYKLKEPSFDLPDGLSPKGSRRWVLLYKNEHFSKWPVLRLSEEQYITN